METLGPAEAETATVRDGVELTYLIEGERMSVLHFRIAPGTTVPMHDHPHEQAGYLLRGEFTFVLEDGEERLVRPGDSYMTAGDEPHAAENRGDEPVEGIEVFSPPRPPGYWRD